MLQMKSNAQLILSGVLSICEEISMWIDSKQEIAGVNILAIRNYLANTILVNNNHLCQFFSNHTAHPEKIFEFLLKEKYLEEKPSYDSGHLPTELGSRFANAMAAKPIKRKTAEKAIANLIARAKEINKSSKYLCRVEKMTVFGSYLSDKTVLNDVDVEVIIENKFNLETRKQIYDIRMEHAERSGRVFNSFGSRIGWIKDEVYLKLKNRSRTLHLTTEMPDTIKSDPNNYIVIFHDEQ